MLDFERNYRIRRAISQALQQSQKSESQVAERNKQIVIHCKREMLLLLSKWLLELNSASTISEAERQEIQSLTHISLDKWLQLQAIATQTEKDLKDAEDKEKEARALLNKKTPFGTVTKMVADAESKMQIKALENNVAAAQKHREDLSKQRGDNVKTRQALGEAFFRDCLRQWDKLALTRALGKETGVIRNRMTQETNALWMGHLKQQTEDLDQIAKLIESLRENYKDTPTSPSRQTKVPSPQEQSDTQSRQGNSL